MAINLASHGILKWLADETREGGARKRALGGHCTGDPKVNPPVTSNHFNGRPAEELKGTEEPAQQKGRNGDWTIVIGCLMGLPIGQEFI